MERPNQRETMEHLVEQMFVSRKTVQVWLEVCELNHGGSLQLQVGTVFEKQLRLTLQVVTYNFELNLKNRYGLRYKL